MKRITLVIILIIISFSIAANCYAALPSIVPEECRGARAGTDCNLSSIENTALNIAQVILGLAGGLALVMFVYGGFLYVLAGGKEDYVKKGKDVLTYAVIGLVIILTSGVILKYVVQALAG